MVRIGQTESMHVEVWKVSLTELSRILVQKTNAEQQQKMTEAVEQKKHKLRADIIALESLVSSEPMSNL